MEWIVENLVAQGVAEVSLEEPLSKHTTWKVGGPADLFIYPKSKEQCIQTLKVLRDHQVPWFVIGRGSNLLVRDGGIRGAVIKLGKGLDHWIQQGSLVTAGGGFSTVLLAAMTAKRGLSGLEFAAGIPGNIGGAVYMNAGAHGSEISRIFHSAEVLLDSGEIKILRSEDMQFEYRTTVLQKQLYGIVLEATFQLEEGNKAEITSALTKFKDYRRTTQPIQHPCAGSVFRNPTGGSAGQLIEAAGLKGFQMGGAEISTLHGNFIINRGDATANDVLSLIGLIQEKINATNHVDLIPEVHVVGEDS